MTDVMRIQGDGGQGVSEMTDGRATCARRMVPLPAAEAMGVSVRPGVEGDLAFIDDLQRMHSKAVGWMPTGQLEGHIAKGHVMVAEAPGSKEEGSQADAIEPIGYCIAVDKYFKREDTGIVYQMNVLPGRQRGLVGATLLKAMFDSWPYGVRLCCCWCAQDLAANRFWEALGFVPLAFRAGSRKKDRIHIFWQKPVRAADEAAAAQGEFCGWWFPSQTGSGALREDRIVLPVPPGTHWSDAKPRVLPGVAALLDEAAAKRKAIEDANKPSKEERRAERAATKAAAEAAKQRAATIASGGLRFGGGPVGGEGLGVGAGAGAKGGAEKPVKKKAKAAKNDPRLVAAARELRDRWLEKVADEPGLLGPGEGAKYAIGREVEETFSTKIAIDHCPAVDSIEVRLLDAA